ncbi:hypothetical protein DWY70_05310 [Bacteroides fragilis]|nr:hypothetical protein DWY70_05310 [Bacteroides fragilis]RHB22678.1 hypothetical protein DW891_10395 [Bacteroides fragilis]
MLGSWVRAPGGSLRTKEKSIKSLIIKYYQGFLFSGRWQKIAVSSILSVDKIKIKTCSNLIFKILQKTTTVHFRHFPISPEL